MAGPARLAEPAFKTQTSYIHDVKTSIVADEIHASTACHRPQHVYHVSQYNISISKYSVKQKGMYVHGVSMTQLTVGRMHESDVV